MKGLSRESINFGEKLAALTMGIDRLYRKELSNVGALDGLVVVNMGFDKIMNIDSYEDARKVLAEMATEAFKLPEDDRRLYYTQACISLDSFCLWRMNKLNSIKSQVGMFLHVNPAPASQNEIDSYKSEMHKLLTSMGYSGNLKTQMAEWEKRNTVPKENVKEVMAELMAVARERTAEILPVPENDFYKCDTETDAAYNARSDFANRTVWINTDPILTKPGLKHLVCHECYPGHFMQFSLRKKYYEEGLAAADGLLSVVNHSSSSTFEGIADAGIEFINWDNTNDDRISYLLSTLRSALGTITSYQMHMLKLSEKEIENYLRENTLAGGEGWIKNRMKFVKDPARSALIWSYWRGDQGTFDVWRNVKNEEKAKYFDYIYGRLHTVQSMQLFK